MLIFGLFDQPEVCLFFISSDDKLYVSSSFFVELSLFWNAFAVDFVRITSRPPFRDFFFSSIFLIIYFRVNCSVDIKTPMVE